MHMGILLLRRRNKDEVNLMHKASFSLGEGTRMKVNLMHIGILLLRRRNEDEVMIEL